VDLEHLRLASKLYPDIVQDRHEALSERFELLSRVPDLADSEGAVRTDEGGVVFKPVRREAARRLKTAEALVVLLR